MAHDHVRLAGVELRHQVVEVRDDLRLGLSNTILVAPPDEEEHPATKPGTASAAVPSPTVFIIVRRLIPEAGFPATLWVAVCFGLPDRVLLTRRMPPPFEQGRPSSQARWLG